MPNYQFIFHMKIKIDSVICLNNHHLNSTRLLKLITQTQKFAAIINTTIMLQSFQTSTISTKHVKINVIFLGNMGVGKSSIIQRYVKNTFSSSQDPTLGLDRLQKTTTYNNVSYKLALWDTAGQERYRSMIPAYLKMGKFCLVVFDVTDRKSFEALSEWINLCEQCKPNQSTIAVVGNKMDLDRAVTKEEGRGFAKKLGYEYFEVSARTGENITSMFNSLIKTWNRVHAELPSTIEQVDAEGRKSAPQSTNKIEINQPKPWDKERNNCCHI